MQASKRASERVASGLQWKEVSARDALLKSAAFGKSEKQSLGKLRYYRHYADLSSRFLRRKLGSYLAI
jgi:hypothetical protein